MCPDQFDIDRLRQSALVARVEYYATISSTNDRAKQYAAEDEKQLPLLVVAQSQTAGRGRGGKRWWTGAGTLAFSLLFDAQALRIDRGRLSLVALATGVAVVEAVTPYVPGLPLGIHWPNDVYIGDRKLAGILVEAPSDRYFVVGIGVNVNNTLDNAPAELAHRVTTLRELTGAALDHTEVLLGVLASLDKWLRTLASDSAAVASRVDSLCTQRGEMIAVDFGGQVVNGRCAGIAPDGALQLDTPEGVRNFYSGVVRE